MERPAFVVMRTSARQLCLAVVFVVLLLPPNTSAQPQFILPGGPTVAGTVTHAASVIQETPSIQPHSVSSETTSTTVALKAPRTVLYMESFNLAADHTLNFTFSDADDVVLHVPGWHCHAQRLVECDLDRGGRRHCLQLPGIGEVQPIIDTCAIPFRKDLEPCRSS